MRVQDICRMLCRERRWMRRMAKVSGGSIHVNITPYEPPLVHNGETYWLLTQQDGPRNVADVFKADVLAEKIRLWSALVGRCL